jgi:hypothetical protein
MNTKILFASLCLVFWTSSCEKKTTEPADEGDITISSQIFGSSPVFYVNAFSFETGKEIPATGGGGEVADVLAEQIRTVSGDVAGMRFSTFSSNTWGFFLNGEFNSSEAALSFYNNYTEATDGPWTEQTDTVFTHQVYTFRTYLGNYVKFIVKETRIMESPGAPDYAEADIRYYIQRNGTTLFEE